MRVLGGEGIPHRPRAMLRDAAGGTSTCCLCGSWIGWVEPAHLILTLDELPLGVEFGVTGSASE